jgi:ribokinase
VVEHRRVVVVGAINVDLVVAAERLPGPGETVVGERLERHGGGKGANAAVAAARTGEEVRLVGAVGDDAHGIEALAELRDSGVDVGGVAVLAQQTTGVALIVVDGRGENQIAVAPGANAAISASHVREALREALPGAGCVLVSTEIAGAAVVAAVEEASARGVTCILNTAPPIPEVLGLLECAPILTPNAGELDDLLTRLQAPGGRAEDAPSRERLAERARALTARTRAPIVVTIGGEGALVVRPGRAPVHVPGFAATVRDTTGAGDAFNGALATRLAIGEDLLVAVRFATAAASLSVAHVGARDGMPRVAAVEAALARSP